MKHIIPSLALLFSLLTSCSLFDSRVGVTDRGFEMLPSVEWSPDLMAYTLRISLDGMTDGRRFLLRYLIDSDVQLAMKNVDGSALPGVSSVEVGAGMPLQFILPALAAGSEHSMTVVMSEGGVERTAVIRLPATDVSPVDVSIDTESSREYTRVVLSNPMAQSSPRYFVSLLLDDEPLQGVKHLGSPVTDSFQVDFSRASSYTLELPYVTPGGHVLGVVLTSSRTSYRCSQGFVEPSRGGTQLHLSYDAFSGNLMVASPYNPTSTSFDFSVGMTVTGEVTYRHALGIGVASAKTETLRLTGSALASGITPSLMPVSIDGGTLRGLLDEIHSQSRTDAANFIGNANRRECHFSITSVRLDYTIHTSPVSTGASTTTQVVIMPSVASGMPITYTYRYGTYSTDAGYQVSLIPAVTVNGGTIASATKL